MVTSEDLLLFIINENVDVALLDLKALVSKEPVYFSV